MATLSMSLDTRRSAVFLDRDGVLNHPVIRDGKPYPPATVEALRIISGVEAACESLRSAGFLLVMVTNQPDIGRGSASALAVQAINSAVAKSLHLDAVKLCPHDDHHACSCRKPLPGLLLEAARDLAISLPSSYVVGDRWRDIEAGERAGCKTVFIDYNYQEKRPARPDFITASLAQATEWIVSDFNRNGGHREQSPTIGLKTQDLR